MIFRDDGLLGAWRDRRDGDAFQSIVNQHGVMVFHTGLWILGNAADAEDVAQESFESLLGARVIYRGFVRLAGGCTGWRRDWL